MNVHYDPEADCPVIKNFLNENFYEGDIPLVQDLLGYILLRPRTPRAYLFLGDGANGKSTFLTLLKRFIGKNNHCSVGLQELEENKFAVAELRDKAANIYDDAPADHFMKYTSIFKVITSGDLLYGERMGGEPFSFVNYSTQVFSANDIPEMSQGFFRRWTFITLPNQFTGDQADRGLIKKLTTQEELSGLLNWALEGLNERGAVA